MFIDMLAMYIVTIGVDIYISDTFQLLTCSYTKKYSFSKAEMGSFYALSGTD